MPWLEDPTTAAMALHPLALPLFVLVSAFLEYVFPPYWGDTFLLLGFFLAGQGAVSTPWVFAAALAGSILGSMAAFGLGRRYGLALVRRISVRRPGKSRRRTQELFQRFGERVLMVNRFLPVIRGVMLYGAGALRMRFWPSIAYCAVSNLLFVALLLWLGLLAAGSWQELLATARRANLWLGLAATAAVAAWLVVFLMRARRQNPPSVPR